jgi:sulfur carrier protein
MRVLVNDAAREVSSGARVAELLLELGLTEARGLAVALNDEVVPRAEWGRRELREGDAVLIIRASQGG